MQQCPTVSLSSGPFWNEMLLTVTIVLTIVLASILCRLASILWRWWTWPALDEWICRNVKWRGVSVNHRAALQMHKSAVSRAINRYNTASGENVEFLHLAKPPLLLFLRRFTILRSSTWALVRTASGAKLIFLKGWFTSDSAVPEFFDI
ncbi:MAG: hypothetical protein DWI22_17055 [Planctomycetota bacterium]|jgi:hypothetical protein|nr:MAG: hypothetical protein DWI22_17055 [Planctomycetota bacterium]